MATRFDLAIDGNDLVIDNNTADFIFAPSDEQHIEDTINAFPGWWKEFPMDGVGIAAWLGGPVDKQVIAKKIRIELEKDAYTVNNPSITADTSGNLIINPNATI